MTISRTGGEVRLEVVGPQHEAADIAHEVSPEPVLGHVNRRDDTFSHQTNSTRDCSRVESRESAAPRVQVRPHFGQQKIRISVSAPVCGQKENLRIPTQMTVHIVAERWPCDVTKHDTTLIASFLGLQERDKQQKLQTILAASNTSCNGACF